MAEARVGTRQPKKQVKKKTTKGKQEKPPKETAKCLTCGEEKEVAEFYTSPNPLHKNGLFPICKDCIKSLSFNTSIQDVDEDKFKDVLRQLDYPFIKKVWDSSIASYEKRYYGKDLPAEHRSNIVGEYFRIAQRVLYTGSFSWKDNEYLNRREGSNYEIGGDLESVSSRSSSKGVVFGLTRPDYKVTADTIRLFGDGYTDEEYRLMQEKYDRLIINYPATTSFHIEALANFVRYRVKAEQATVRGDVSEAKKWEDMAQTAADKAKINPSQLSQQDLQGGLNSFSELFKAVEEAEDIVPILPQFKYRPNDAPDFIIWCYVNYIRGLEGKPLCEYEDIYKFYDERKREYINQYGDPYGIFSGDTAEKNRANIEKFIDVPEDNEEGFADEQE